MKQLNDAINDVLVEWSVFFIQEQRAAASKINRSTGKGAQSFGHEVRKATTSDVASALFVFESYLRFADMRKLKWNQLPPADKIIEWIKQQGIEKFTQGFSKKRSIPKSQTKLLNEIAWGIRKKKFAKSKHKRIRWYNKQKERSIASLYGHLLKAASTIYLKNLKQSLE